MYITGVYFHFIQRYLLRTRTKSEINDTGAVLQKLELRSSILYFDYYFLFLQRFVVFFSISTLKYAYYYSRTIYKHHEAEDDAPNEEILHLILWNISAICNLLFVILQFCLVRKRFTSTKSSSICFESICWPYPKLIVFLLIVVWFKNGSSFI